MNYQVIGLENDHPVREMLLNLLPAEDNAPGSCEENQLNVEVWQSAAGYQISARAQREGVIHTAEREIPLGGDEKRALSHAVKLAVYDAVTPYLEHKPVWGSLTGVRPAKFARGFLEKGLKPFEAAKIMTEDYRVTPERRALAIRSAAIAMDAQKALRPKDISIYVGIPFCPSRCSYCSFVSHSIERAAHLIAPYLGTLCGEIKAAGDAVREAGLRVVSVYIGGGTPTTLSAEQLDILLYALETCFDLSEITEFTVEAGRPDTITEAKLRTLAAHGVDRISINPQSMNDEVLAAIGRRHSAEDVIRTYETARRIGFKSINMDTIAGLEKDTPESFVHTLETLIGLEPENLTVHTLAVKRGATQQDRAAAQQRHDDVRRMLDAAYPMLTAADYAPYYLYRQKFMAGGYENTGWCRPGFECLYNVYMMEELQTILSLGAGGVTKLLSTDGRQIRRISNPKYPYEYNVSLEKISAAKRELVAWADTL